MVRANRDLEAAKVSYDTVIAPKHRAIAQIKKNTMISSRKQESAQIRVNQLATTISRMTKKIEFRRIDFHSVSSRNDIMHSRLESKEQMLKTLRAGVKESKLRSSSLNLKSLAR